MMLEETTMRRTMMAPQHTRHAWRLLALVPFVALVATPVLAEVSKQDRKCIETINKTTRKVALAENKELDKCVRSFIKGALLTPTVVECAAPENSAKIDKTADKAILAAVTKCLGLPPSFGPTALNAHPARAIAASVGLFEDLFGSPSQDALTTDPTDSKCQRAVLKLAQKCQKTRIDEFNKCKKSGMKDGAITDVETLVDKCLGSGIGQPDPKGKIGRACSEKPVSKIVSKCESKNVALDDAFPGCDVTDAASLTECIDRRSSCRVCALMNSVDSLTRDCDILDDGIDANNSCEEPTICGDNIIDGAETCDDGNAAADDGCSDTCQSENGYVCTGEPSTCNTVCGDGVIAGDEACDDDNPDAGDGCSDDCLIEAGFVCTGEPSGCVTTCGDSIVAGLETCDDGGTSTGDGCDDVCLVETGYACPGQPSECDPICGDGLIIGDEECDDEEPLPGDGCSANCTIEFGFVCINEPSECTGFDVVITAPANGSFTQASSVNVTGFVSDIPPAQADLTINGVSVPVDGGGNFSTSVSLVANDIFNPIRATVEDTIGGAFAHDRLVVIVGDSVADGALSDQSIGLRLTDDGLDAVEPLVATLAGGGLDLADLLPVGTVLVDDVCFIDSIFGCLGSATVRVANPPPSFSSFGLAMNSQTNFVEGDVTVSDIQVDVDLEGSGLVPNCDITINADNAFFDGDYTLEPDVIPTQIDVNLIGALDVSFTAFSTSFGGICDTPVIGDIIQAFLPDVEALTIDAVAGFLGDPDGGGPQDSPIAEAIEVALAGIEITGPIGQGLGVMVAAPLFAVTEDVTGFTLGSDSSFTTEIGAGPGQCLPPPGAADLTASLAITQAFPPFGPTTPVGGLSYDFGLGISSEGFNQLLKAQIECGLLVTSIAEIDLGGGSAPITAGVLKLLMSQFSMFDDATPFRIDIRPTIAPVVGNDPGPGGELAVLKIAQVIVSVVQDDGSEAVALAGAFDADIGMDLEFAAGGLGFLLSAPAPADITVAITNNPLGVDEAALENDVLPPLIALLLPDLAGGLASFPLPDFLGLSLGGVEVSRNGQFLTLFATLDPAP